MINSYITNKEVKILTLFMFNGIHSKQNFCKSVAALFNILELMFFW